jgi:hypothetical protein
MTDRDIQNIEAIVDRLRRQSSAELVRLTVHAHQEMVEEQIVLEDVLGALSEAKVVENYPNHKRGPCCLICGRGRSGKYLHIVCTSSLEVAIIITVYEPMAPKWVTPFERGEAR